MKQKLSHRNVLVIGTMLFGLFFGAGNLIFPIHLGQLSGNAFLPATAGFMITAVGLPFLAVLALSLSKSDGVYWLALKVNKPFAMFFTTLLYLTIGPLFALPRLAAVSFEVALSPYLSSNSSIYVLILFSALFYTTALYLSSSKQNMMTIVGKVITPIFLVLLGALIVFAVFNPMGSIKTFEAISPYDVQPFFASFIDGYQTMDALAALAFGIVVVDALKRLGITDTKAKSVNLLKAGVVASLMMLVLYAGLMYIGASSRGVFEIAENGGITLANVVKHYFKFFGHIAVAAIITLGCLKTAIGLISASSQTFHTMSNKRIPTKYIARGVTLFAACTAVFGLNIIIEFAVPMLMFIYPLTIALIILGITSPLLPQETRIYKSVIGFTFIASFGDVINALPKHLHTLAPFKNILDMYQTYVPFFNIQLGWVVFVIIGFMIGFSVDILLKRKNT